ncbi:MAG: hypothetical protein EA422_01065 [Gemmatimonadales bacterium]|nr:MAG: hypothetical protein EA422_01065 [Gemmatimonadales bacterium]
MNSSIGVRSSAGTGPSPTLYLCGAGNPEGVRLALRLARSTGRWSRLALLDDDPKLLGVRKVGVAVEGPFSHLASVDRARAEVVSLVARTTRGRADVAARIEEWGIPWTGLVSSDVDLWGAQTAPDLVVYQNATIGPEARIEPGCVVFMGAAVGHGSRLGRHCVVGANAVLNARVRIGDRVYVGTNATILPEVTVGDDVTIGAGVTVVDDVPAGATVFAEPARVVEGRRGTDGPSYPFAEPALSEPALSGLEREMAEIWGAVLDLDQVPKEANFFDLGGTSLAALRIVGRANERFGPVLCPVDLFEFSTVRTLTRKVAGGGSSASVGAGELGSAQRRGDARRRILSRTPLR